MSPMVSLCASLGIDRGGRLPSDRVLRGGHALRLDRRARFPRRKVRTPFAARSSRRLKCRETGEEKCILFNLSGHGLCDMSSYDRFLGNKLVDYAYPQEKIEEAIAELPVIE